MEGIMVSMQLAAVLLAVSGTGDTVLLDFQTSWCGPCRAMAPVMSQLSAAGYPIRKVDAEQEPALAAQFRIDQYPTFVLVVNGREVERAVGGRGAGEFQAM